MHWPKPHRNGDFEYSIGVPTYPDNWKDLATACKQRAGWRCEECGSTERLGAAHVNHDPENPNPELRCLCWPCHSRYDVTTGAAHAGKNARRAATRERNREKESTKPEPYVSKASQKKIGWQQRSPKMQQRETALERARRISREVQEDPFRFNSAMIWPPGMRK
jgi:hypothetical protein